MNDPVKVELVGGTRDSNPWHDHRVMLVSPEIAIFVARAARGWRLGERERRCLDAFVCDWSITPRVHADDDAIRWLCERQGDAA